MNVRARRTLTAASVSWTIAAAGATAAEGDAHRLMREVEAAFRATPRLLQMEIQTKFTLAYSGATRELRVRIAGVHSGGSDVTEQLYVFTHPGRMEGTALIISDPWGEPDDEAWIFLPSVRRFQRLLPGSLRLRVPETSLTYEDVRGFLSTDKYTFEFPDEPPTLGGRVRVVARPKTPELARAIGYSHLEVLVDVPRRALTRVVYRGASGAVEKRYRAREFRKVGESWLATVSRLQDLSNAIASQARVRYWPLDEPPPEDLLDVRSDAGAPLERLRVAFTRAGAPVDDW